MFTFFTPSNLPNLITSVTLSDLLATYAILPLYYPLLRYSFGRKMIKAFLSQADHTLTGGNICFMLYECVLFDNVVSMIMLTRPAAAAARAL